MPANSLRVCCVVYVRLWRAGRPDGPGRYVWACGTEYDGEWVAGHMHGHGTMVWTTGDRYDGMWQVRLGKGSLLIIGVTVSHILSMMPWGRVSNKRARTPGSLVSGAEGRPYQL